MPISKEYFFEIDERKCQNKKRAEILQVSVQSHTRIVLCFALGRDTI